MTGHAWVELVVLLGLLPVLGYPLGRHMARIYEGETPAAVRWMKPLERACLRLSGARTDAEMTWREYALSVLIFSGAGLVLLFLIQRLQGSLPWNPVGLPGVRADLAFNTAVSFVTNTNWQSYGGETTMSHLTQMLGLTVQNFASAATGMAVLAATIRGLARRSVRTIGSFWIDLFRGTIYILLPLALILALALAGAGVVQTLRPSATVETLEPASGGGPHLQTIALGPVASQVAIKQLGTNGGGFFNVNASHPLENPTPFTNLLQLVSILLIPAALCFTFGRMIRDERQGWALFLAMALLLMGCLIPTIAAEQAGTPGLERAGADLLPSAAQAGGNMEGKEVRFGIVSSAIWAIATTAASNGSVNAMHDSFTPLGGMFPMVLMQVGEVVFGGVGSGLYGMLAFVVVAVFVSGLMVGRTPEYLGKKIESFEMKMASLMILLPPIAVLAGTAVAVASPAGRAGIANPGAHGFSEILYAFSSAGNNNGSAFAGLSANAPFYNFTFGVAMLAARFGPLVAALALGGSMGCKVAAPAGAGTLPTHTPTFVVMLIAVVLIVGALTFIPALSLGPIVEHLEMLGGRS